MGIMARRIDVLIVNANGEKIDASYVKNKHYTETYNADLLIICTFLYFVTQ